MRHNESRLQMMCVRWFRLQYPELAPLLFAVPNGGKRNAREAEFLRAEGVTAGVADLLLLVPYCGGLTSPPTPPKVRAALAVGAMPRMSVPQPPCLSVPQQWVEDPSGVWGRNEPPHTTSYGLCIEMKWGKGRQSEHQRAWQEAVTQQGYRYEIVRSFEDFQALIQEYIGRRAASGNWRNTAQASHT